MSAAAPTISNKHASAAKRNPAMQLLVTSSTSGVAGTSTSDAPETPTAGRALTPRGGYYVSRTTGRVVSWAELKDTEREGEGNMTYFYPS
ncbi:hypothetical protein K525DRAFT_280063 [Schizophyllum commune Loenen D]|nr:hypothetical protein K525DRAFT_280063 [Schizophyllum commune Loenen D]